MLARSFVMALAIAMPLASALSTSPNANHGIDHPRSLKREDKTPRGVRTLHHHLFSCKPLVDQLTRTIEVQWHLVQDQEQLLVVQQELRLRPWFGMRLTLIYYSVPSTNSHSAVRR